MPWDRHKVRNCPVTQALGLLHGTAEQQAASPCSGGRLHHRPWAEPSLVPAGMGLCWSEPGMAPGSDLPPWERWRDQWANKGLLWALFKAAAPLPCVSDLPEKRWGVRSGEQALYNEWTILCTVVTVLCHLPAPSLQLWHIIDHSINSVMLSSFQCALQTFRQYMCSP